MQTRIINQGEEDAFQELARSSGNVFYSPEWQRIYGESLLRIGVFSKKGLMVGGLLLVKERRMGVRFWRNPPYASVCGPFMNIQASHPVAVLEATRKIVDAVAAFLVPGVMGGVAVSLDLSVQDAMPLCWKGFKVTPKYTYRIDLSHSEDELIKRFSSVRRRNISAAKRDKLVVKSCEDMGQVRDLVLGTFERQGKWVDRALVEKILFEFVNSENSYAYVTWDGERAIGCTFVIHDRNVAYYLLGGYESEQAHQGAGASAMLESIKEAKRRGLKIFDFEGSMIPAIERYFRGFGGDLVHGFMLTRAWLPLEMVMKLRNRNWF